MPICNLVQGIMLWCVWFSVDRMRLRFASSTSFKKDIFRLVPKLFWVTHYINTLRDWHSFQGQTKAISVLGSLCQWNKTVYSLVSLMATSISLINISMHNFLRLNHETFCNFFSKNTLSSYIWPSNHSPILSTENKTVQCMISVSWLQI